MGKIHRYIKLVFLFRYPCIGAILLGILFNYCITQSPTVVTVNIQGESGGLMALYWPNDRGGFSSDSIVSTEYPVGQNEQRLTFINKFSQFPLRFDPYSGTLGVENGSIKEQRLIIENISFSKLGVEVAILGGELPKYIDNLVEIDVEKQNDNLLLKSTSADPQVFFFQPSLSKSFLYLVILYSIGLVLLFGMQWLVKNKPVVRDFKSNVFVMLVMPLCLGVFLCQNYVQLMILSLLIIVLLQLFLLTAREFWWKEQGLSFFTKTIPVVLFLLLIGIPFVATTISLSFIENMRNNSFLGEIEEEKQSPHSNLKNIFEGIDKQFSQSYEYKSDLINLNAKIKIFGFGYTPTPKAILGKDGMFFEGHGARRIEGDKVGYFDNITDYLGLLQFTERELEQWRITLEERYYWLQEQGIAYVFAVAPNKSQVYPEKYPHRINSIKSRGETRYDQLLEYLKSNSIVPVVNLQEAMLEAKQKGLSGSVPKQNLFYRTDFHWNYYGAFWAYKAIVREINKSYPQFNLPDVKIDDFTIHEKTDWVHPRFMQMLGLKNEEQRNDTYLTLFPKSQTIHATSDTFFKNGINDDTSIAPNETVRLSKTDQTIRQFKNEIGQIPLLVLVGDSFSEKMFGYFSIHAERSINYRAVTAFKTGLIEELQPDIVIQEVLNMYLLQHPPVNVKTVKMARRRALQD